MTGTYDPPPHQDSLRCERRVRDRLFSFCDWCAQHDEIVAAVITRITNATSECLNRLAKLEARLAYGFRNP
jgi:hypothetical protein